ncbi:hypothetical protein HPB47_013862 [Ixodes persulcatus]|uniref:Uncharacterized protein n=1 Tax=Ixodes persulcatus TaxID=34615 RepID=A0AC60QYD0_IXOPE|nr:hypothetical protein HPB47_013862 [Ixodes persulcatus]
MPVSSFARPGTQKCAGLATAPAEFVLVPQGRELRDSSACPPPSLGSSGLLETRNPTLRPLSHLHLRNDRRLQDPTYGLEPSLQSCTIDWRHNDSSYKSFTLVYFVLGFLVPACIVLVCYRTSAINIRAPKPKTVRRDVTDDYWASEEMVTVVSGPSTVHASLSIF